MPIPPDLPEAIEKDNLAFMEIEWLMPLVGFAELLGGLLILLSKTRALGALIVFPVMVGVLLTHILVAPEGLIIAFVISIKKSLTISCFIKHTIGFGLAVFHYHVEVRVGHDTEL